jgi:hypothetical protein
MIIRKGKIVIHIFFLTTYNQMITGEKDIRALECPWKRNMAVNKM